MCDQLDQSFYIQGVGKNRWLEIHFISIRLILKNFLLNYILQRFNFYRVYGCQNMFSRNWIYVLVYFQVPIFENFQYKNTFDSIKSCPEFYQNLFVFRVMSKTMCRSLEGCNRMLKFVKEYLKIKRMASHWITSAEKAQCVFWISKSHGFTLI